MARLQPPLPLPAALLCAACVLASASARHGTLQPSLPSDSRPFMIFPETDGDLSADSNKLNAGPRFVSEWPLTYQGDGFPDNFSQRDIYYDPLRESHWSNGSRLKRQVDSSSFARTKFEGNGECFPPCGGEGGVCFEKTCSCNPSYFGPGCDKRQCIAPFIENGLFSRVDDDANHLLLSCAPNFGFSAALDPSDLSESAPEKVAVYCVGGKWQTNSSTNIEEVACEVKKCSVQCKNKGACGQSPYKCDCPGLYFGKSCEYLEDSSCGDDMKKLSYDHAKHFMSADTSRANVVCDEGYQLAGGAQSDVARCSRSKRYIGGKEVVNGKVSCIPICPGGCGEGSCQQPGVCQCPPNTAGSRCTPVQCPPPPTLTGGKLVTESLSKGFATFQCDEGLVTSHPFTRMSSGLLSCVEGHWGVYVNNFIGKTPDIPEKTTYSLDSTFKSITNSKSTSSNQNANNSGLLHDIYYEYEEYGYVKSDKSNGKTSQFLLDKRFEDLLDFTKTHHDLTVETYILLSEDNSLKCERPPDKDCGPFGVLDENKICQCEAGFSGEACEKKSCLVSFPTIDNGFTSISNKKVEYKCPKTYSLGAGIAVGTAECASDSWKVASNVPAALTCEASCDYSYKLDDEGNQSDNEQAFLGRLTPAAKAAAKAQRTKSCLFTGKCTKPNTCKCPSGRSGSFCQIIPCKDYFSQHTMANVEVHYVEYVFNELPRLDLACTNEENALHELTCIDGKWYTRNASAPAPGSGEFRLSDWVPFEANNKVCPAVCEKVCLNKGQCVKNDQCLCSSEWTGPDCGELRCMKDLSAIILRGSISQSVQANATSGSQAIDELTCSEGFVLAKAKGSAEVRQSLILCKEGRYILAASGQEISEDSCVPRCSTPCQNGAPCVAPDTCKCPAGFTGAACDQRACRIQAEANLAKEGDKLFLRCPLGMFVSTNVSVVEVVCSGGVYVAAGGGAASAGSKEEVKCVQGCVKKCENKGVCVGINMCACAEGYSGKFCTSKSCSEKAKVKNGVLNFNASELGTANLVCDSGFSTVSGGAEAKVLCIEGSWYSPKGGLGVPSPSGNQSSAPQAPQDVSLTYPVDDICTKDCKEDCKNGGTCISKNKCKCPEGFEGLLCENKVCPIIEIVAGSINKSGDGYVVVCDAGYFFSSGLSEMSAVCDNGNWKFPAQESNVGVAPQCLQGCPTPCQNGGKCTGFKKCMCRAEYDGELCEKVGCPNEYPKVEHGNFQLIDGHVLQVCDKGYIHHADMKKGEIMCFKGEWIKQVANPLVDDTKYHDCVEACKAECQNGGTCLGKIKGCACVPPFRGEFCEYQDCDMALRPAAPLRSNVTFERVEYNYEKHYACPKGFFYKSGSETIKTACQNGVWIVEEGSLKVPVTLAGDKACTEGCPKGCDNGGTCAGIGKCKCPEGFEGDRCENFMCKLPSATEINGNIMKNEDGSRYLVCHEGYELPGSALTLEVHCVHSFWVSLSVAASDTSVAAHESCRPTCEPPCKNAGVCVRPGTCDCPAKTTGPRCADFLCEHEPPTALANGTIEKRSPSEVTYRCDDGYRFITGLPQSFLKCLAAGWSLIEEDGEAAQLQPKDLVCEKLKNCEDELPTVRNANLEYVGEKKTPVLRCYPGYSLQTGDGQKEFEPLCVAGQWVITMSQKLGCVPECPLACRSGGVCVAPSVCQCPKEYGGPQCQDKLCLQPLKGNNFTVSVRGSDVFATCEPGYLFKYGEPTIQVGCRDGNWVYPFNYALAQGSLVCVPVCMPPCENNGTCMAPGVCQCDEKYSGELCQNKEACASAAPRLPNSVTENVGGGFYLAKCSPSFVFTSNVKFLELRCKDGNWSYTGYDNASSLPTCLSLTGSLCNGTSDLQACGLLYAPECEILPPLVPNATVIYNTSGGEVECDEGYFLNTGDSSTPFKCFGDKWSYPECETDEPPACKPKCRIPCRHEGVCTAPDQCTCAPGYTGPHCEEILPDACVDPPAPIPNAAVLISAQQQYVVCAKGYEFPSERVREQIWCKDGEWMFKTQSTEDVTRGCYPVCGGEGCLNGGVCIAPDVCSCVPPFSGPNCGKLDQESCLNPASAGKHLELVYNATVKISSCSAGYVSTIAGVMAEAVTWEETCSNGKWTEGESGKNETEEADGSGSAPEENIVEEIAQRNCSPICKRPCLNGGVCTAPDTCTCEPGFTGPTCEEQVPANCSLLPHFVAGGYLTYRYPEEEVIVQCLPGYEVTAKATHTTLQCQNGEWFTTIASLNVTISTSVANIEGPSGLPAAGPVNTLHNVPPSAISEGDNVAAEYKPSWYPLETLTCAAVCQKPCLNNGTCVAPEKCTCLGGYAGDQCQVEKCDGAPKKIRNSMMIFSDDYLSGVARCRSGYKLPDGDIAARFQCKNKAWLYHKDYVSGDKPESPSAAKSPRKGESDASVAAPFDSCLPVCSQPCLNGGWCVAPNTCRCTEGFFGGRCNMRYSKTVNGSACVFPFIFRGTRHFGCTGAGHHKPWCATAVTETEQVVSWDICVADLGLKKVVLTENRTECVFPFVYRNIEYHRCTTVDRTRGWCATKVHQKAIMVEWGFCAPDQGGTEVAITSEGVICQLPFQYGNREYTTCVQDAHTPWCVVGQKQPALRNEFQKATDYSSPESEIVYGVCLAHWGHTKVEVTRQGHLCVFPFQFGGEKHTSCATNSSAPQGFQLWCATEVSPKGKILAKGVCIDEREVARLSSTLLVDVYPHLNLIFPNIRTMGNRWCVFPFSYKKKMYTACTNAAITPGSLVGASIDTYVGKLAAQPHGRPRDPDWCATAVDVDSTALEYDICSDDWKRVYENFTRSLELKASFFPPGEEILIQIGTKHGYNCSLPFLYRGLRYFGCVTEEDGKFVKPWCAVTVAEDGTPLLTDECVADWNRNCPASALQPQPALLRDQPPSAMYLLPTDPTIITTSGTPCVMPFMYQGRLRSACIGDTKPWCPTQLDHTGDPLAWDYCPESLPNVPRERTDDQRASKKETLLTATQTFTIKGFRCVFPFVHEDVTYETCTAVGGSNLWCATAVDVAGKPLSSDDCVTHDDDQGGYTEVMTRSGLPCVFPFYYKQHQFSTCTRYSTELQDFIKSDASDSFDPSKLYSTPDQFTKNTPQGASLKISPDVFRDYSPLSSPILDTGHEDFAAISAAQVTRLSEINLDGQLTKDDVNAWCAVAVDFEGVVTMKSECVGSFKTDTGVRTFQAFYTSHLQENFGRPKYHDVNLMEKFLKEDESSWVAASQHSSLGASLNIPIPHQHIVEHVNAYETSDAETLNNEVVESNQDPSVEDAGEYRQYRSSPAVDAGKEGNVDFRNQLQRSWSHPGAKNGQQSVLRSQKTIPPQAPKAEVSKNSNPYPTNFQENTEQKRLAKNYEGMVPRYLEGRRW